MRTNQPTMTRPVFKPAALAAMAAVAMVAALAGCNADPSAASVAAETLAPRPWLETLAVDG